MKRTCAIFSLMWLLYACGGEGQKHEFQPPVHPTPPQASRLYSPADKACEVMEPLAFSWSEEAGQEGATYKLYLSEDRADWTLVSSQTTTSFLMNNKLEYPATYFWKVETVNKEGLTATSGIRSFSTAELYADGEVKQLLAATKGAGVDIVVTGDGFVREDMAPNGVFEQAAARVVNTLELAEPFKTYKEYFNVYCIFALSNERGADYDVSLTQLRDTKFNTRFDNTSMSSTFITADNEKIFEFVTQKLGRRTIDETLIITMLNAPRKAGYCHFWMQGRAIAFCPVADNPPGEWFEKCVLHEGFGHGFAKLGDEYINGPQKDSSIPHNSSDWSTLNTGISKGAFFNISTTGSPDDIKWKDLIDPNDERYDCVGAFEGAFYWGKGVWRSENTSCMINNIKYFNAPSRFAIVKRIKYLAGEGELSISDFKAKDRHMNRPWQNIKIESVTRSMPLLALPQDDFHPNDPPSVYFD